MNRFDIVGPKTIEEILSCLAESKGKVAFLSGGTDFIIDLREKGLQQDLVIDLSQVEELNYIKAEDDWIKIGAATTFAQIGRDELIEKSARCLAQAARQIGSVQIRNRATIGGNVASAAPAGDSLPALLALEAKVSVLGHGGERTVPLDRLMMGAGSTGLKEREFIREIAFPLLNESYISGFEKLGSRRAVSIARLSLAAVIKYNRKENIIEEGRAAAGALGPKACRLLEIEEFLSGKRIDRDFPRQFAHKLQQAVDQAIPGRYSQNYKRHAILGVADDLMKNIFGTIYQGGEVR